MASRRPDRDFAGRSLLLPSGPATTFASCAVMAFATCAAAASLRPDLMLPAVIGLLFGLAAIVALAAWWLPGGRAPGRLNYWDVAGALTFIGVGLSVLVEPEQMAAVVGLTHGDR